MSERRRQIQRPDGTVREAVVVDIAKITATPTIVELTDGTRVTLQININEALRVEGEWGPKGEPQYEVAMQATMQMDIPQDLHKSENNDAH
ncbi:MAG: hypothetical protein OXF94_12840 [Gammaproteobacteria bacterium]|nr:hypothetical protein [Gammaproteobacteria bacterium]